MKPSDLSSGIRVFVPFQLKDAYRVPQSAGCYLITNAYHQILYIGQTEDLRRRMTEHLSDIRMTTPTTIGRATWYYYQKITDSRLKDAEDRLLMTYKINVGRRPPLNRIGP